MALSKASHSSRGKRVTDQGPARLVSDEESIPGLQMADGRERSLVSLHIKILILLYQSHTLMTSFNIIYFLRVPFLNTATEAST